jgi:DNA-binding CsgD family transcriptional regulator
MSVRSVHGPAHRAGLAPADGGISTRAGMSYTDAITVVASSAAVLVLLSFTDPRDALGYLLAFPIWLVAKDLGAVAGAAAAACALLSVVAGASAQDIVFGPLGYLGYAAVFFGTVAAGTRAIGPGVAGETDEPSSTLPVLTKRPEITQKSDALSRRELQVLDLIATGANNAEIAARFFISQNTVKSHVSRILQKLPAANRTEAAFRYRELYGSPSSSGGLTRGDPDSGQPNTLTATSALTATVAALHRFYGVLHLQDGRELEVPLLEQIRRHVEVGTSAIVYFDHCDRTMGWYLPDKEVGVDLRNWGR